MTITLSALTFYASPNKCSNDAKFGFRTCFLFGFDRHFKFDCLQIANPMLNSLKSIVYIARNDCALRSSFLCVLNSPDNVY